jgi:hypothetical protein
MVAERYSMAAEMTHHLYSCPERWYSALAGMLLAVEVQMAEMLRIRRHFFALPEFVCGA